MTTGWLCTLLLGAARGLCVGVCVGVCVALLALVTPALQFEFAQFGCAISVFMIGAVCGIAGGLLSLFIKDRYKAAFAAGLLGFIVSAIPVLSLVVGARSDVVFNSPYSPRSILVFFATYLMLSGTLAGVLGASGKRLKELKSAGKDRLGRQEVENTQYGSEVALGKFDKCFLRALGWSLTVIPVLQLFIIAQHLLEGWENPYPRSPASLPASVLTVTILAGLLHKSFKISLMTLVLSTVITIICTPLVIAMALFAGYNW